jgi:hypothetical protein
VLRSFPLSFPSGHNYADLLALVDIPVPGVELVHDPRVMFLFRRTSFVSRSNLLVSWLACLDRFPLGFKLFPSFPAKIVSPGVPVVSFLAFKDRFPLVSQVVSFYAFALTP